MDIPLLLIAILVFTTTKVGCQYPDDFGTPPPLPVAGIYYIHTNKHKA